MQEAHPDKDGNESNLGNHPIEAWTEALQSACSLIEACLPEWWREFGLIMNRIVPVGRKHLSASYQEALGLAYISLHPDPLIMAEAIILTSKLNAMWLDQVLVNGNSEWTTSPVRPDMRANRRSSSCSRICSCGGITRHPESSHISKPFISCFSKQ